MRAAQRAEGQPQHFFGRRLAGAAGDGDDLRVCARARGARQIFEPALRVGDRQQRRRCGQIADRALHQRRAGFRGKAPRSRNHVRRARRLSAPRTDRLASACACRWKGLSTSNGFDAVPRVAASASGEVQSAVMPRVPPRC